MRLEYLTRLKGGTDRQRMRAWSDLHLEPEARDLRLSPRDRQQLCRLMMQEEDQKVQREALMTLLSFSCQCDTAPIVEGPSRSGDEIAAKGPSLDEWVWRDFRNRSAICEITDNDFASRDVHARYHLARRLPYTEFRVTEFKPIEQGTNGLNQLLSGGPYAGICLLGRLGLYQRDAVERLEPKGMRFGFPTQYRPAGLHSGELNREFHRIRANARAAGGRPTYYDTEEKDGVRTDYGLVQRFRLFVGNHWMTVILCAGASYLGTWGAAQWLARDLGLPIDGPSGSPIDAPKGISAKSRMEALVRIKADTRQRTWDLANVELVHLSVDSLVWSPDDLKWHCDMPVQFCLVLKGRRPDELRINGEPHSFKPKNNQAFRLAAWTLLEAQKRNGTVPAKILAVNTEIWGGKAVTTTVVKQRLNPINKTHLHRTLAIGDDIRVNAEIVLEKA